jgi:hypothetical protein
MFILECLNITFCPKGIYSRKASLAHHQKMINTWVGDAA